MSTRRSFKMGDNELIDRIEDVRSSIEVIPTELRVKDYSGIYTDNSSGINFNDRKSIMKKFGELSDRLYFLEEQYKTKIENLEKIINTLENDILGLIIKTDSIEEVVGLIYEYYVEDDNEDNECCEIIDHSSHFQSFTNDYDPLPF